MSDYTVTKRLDFMLGDETRIHLVGWSDGLWSVDVSIYDGCPWDKRMSTDYDALIVADDITLDDIEAHIEWENESRWTMDKYNVVL